MDFNIELNNRITIIRDWLIENDYYTDGRVVTVVVNPIKQIGQAIQGTAPDKVYFVIAAALAVGAFLFFKGKK